MVKPHKNGGRGAKNSRRRRVPSVSSSGDEHPEPSGVPEQPGGAVPPQPAPAGDQVPLAGQPGPSRQQGPATVRPGMFTVIKWQFKET